MRTLSKYLLVLESLLLAYPTLLGIILCFGAIIPFLTGGSYREHLVYFIQGILVAAALISGWRIFFWVITGGPGSGVKINPLWWLFAFIGTALTIIALVFNGLDTLGKTHNLPLTNDFLILGGYFLIPFAHLIIEVQWQKGTNFIFRLRNKGY